MDFYEILQVDCSASEEVIKSAYKKKAMEAHPDRGGTDEKFKQVKEAYETLSNKNKRMGYDLKYNKRQPRNFKIDGRELKNVFVKSSRYGTNKDIIVMLDLSLSDVFNGRIFVVSYTTSGNKHEEIPVKIPNNITSNHHIRFDQRGDDMISMAPRGNLVIRVKIKGDKKWGISDSDIDSTQEVNIFDLMTGTVIEVVTPENKKLKIKVSPGTQPGTVLRVSGQGLYSADKRTRGDIKITLNASVPAVVDEELKKKITDFKDCLGKSVKKHV